MNKSLSLFSKITCFSTALLIFIGGMVKSTESGLAVPDWPLSYGTWFPPMIGGVFYEHGHRMAASLVGFLMLIQAIWMGCVGKTTVVTIFRICWISGGCDSRNFGGMTVLHFLPASLSISHGILAQTFFMMTVVISYNLSREHYDRREEPSKDNTARPALWTSLIFIGIVFLQLFLGALMRHTEAGLAIPDFPKMAGQWWPQFNNNMLGYINSWRFDNGFENVTLDQIMYHFWHRLGAVMVLIMSIVLTLSGVKYARQGNPRVGKTIFWIDSLLLLQIILGISTIWTLKNPIVTSLHVVNGALILGFSVLLSLRIAPLKWESFKRCLGGRLE